MDTNIYATKDDLNTLERHLTVEMRILESNLSGRLSNRINDTFWKIIPVMIGLMALINGAFFVAYKVGF